MIENMMWPPSSGSSGSRLRIASERLTSPSTIRYQREARRRDLLRHVDDAGRAGDLLPPGAGNEPRQEGDVAFVARQLSVKLCLSAPNTPKRCVIPAGDESERIAAGDLLRLHRAQHDLLAVARNRDGDRPGPASPDRRRDGRERRRRHVRSTATIVSPGCRPAICAGVFGSTVLTVALTLPGAPIMYATEGQRRARRAMFVPGPAKMTAIRFHVRCRQYASGAETVAQLVQTPFCGPLRAGAELRLRDRALELGQGSRALS